MGATINWQDKNGNTPLHVASISKNSDCMRLLIKSKANLNITNRRGDTSLVCAAQKNKMTAVRELVWSLCDLEIRDSGGKTAVEKAKEWRHKRVAEYLAYKAPQEQVRARARATTRFPGAAPGATRVVRSVRSLAPRSRANHAMRLVL